MGDWHIALAGLWALITITAWPFMSWDAMQERDRPLNGFMAALFFPLAIFGAPVFVAALLAAIALESIPRRISKWWNSPWTNQPAKEADRG